MTRDEQARVLRGYRRRVLLTMLILTVFLAGILAGRTFTEWVYEYRMLALLAWALIFVALVVNDVILVERVPGLRCPHCGIRLVYDRKLIAKAIETGQCGRCEKTIAADVGGPDESSVR